MSLKDPVYAAIALAFILGGALGFAGSRFIHNAPESTAEPLYDAPDSPSVPFKTWESGNWQFKLSDDNPSSAQITILKNSKMPFVITTNGALDPAFFNIDINGTPHQAYSAVSLSGNPKNGLIQEIDLWSANKIYTLKRKQAGDDWQISEADLNKPAASGKSTKK